MQLNPAEISDLIKAKIENLSGNTEVRTRGTVISVTETTVPRVRTSALTDKFSILALIKSLISAGLSCMKTLLICHSRIQSIQFALYGQIQDLITHFYFDAAD